MASKRDHLWTYASGGVAGAAALAEWGDTQATLHMWTQMVGKLRLALSPRVNHWWEVPLYVSARA